MYHLDIRPPSITCPNAISVPTDPGKPTAKICIPKASASDNSGQSPTITNDAGAESKEFAVSSVAHEVKYTATDAAGLTSTCTLQITVSGKWLSPAEFGMIIHTLKIIKFSLSFLFGSVQLGRSFIFPFL